MGAVVSDEIRVTDPVTGGQKGVKSERFDLIPPDGLRELARVYGMGAKKYEPWNWAKGYAWLLSFGAMMRHAWAWAMGESIDPESGLHHMAHVAWHAFTLITFERKGLGTDDRFLGRAP